MFTFAFPQDITPEQIEMYVALAKSLGAGFKALIGKLHAAGVSPEKLQQITADYDVRIPIAEAEAAGDPPVSPV